LKTTLNCINLSFGYHGQSVLDGLSWKANAGEAWMIGGPSGTGKTTLSRIVAGELQGWDGGLEICFDPDSELPAQVHYVSNWFQFTNLEGDRNFYYQQRYNKFAKNDTLTVFAELERLSAEEHLDFEAVEPLLKLFGFDNFRKQQLIELSSGEHKRLQLVKALWQKPQILIVDQPYTGLDVQSRKNLNTVLGDLVAEGMLLVLINSDSEYPSCVRYFAEIDNGKLKQLSSATEISKGKKRDRKPLPYFLQQPPVVDHETVIRMQDVCVSYGEKKVLEHIDWEVKAGEKWLLQGHNGSGKSTLLSLVNGDHPQAYANEIFLFGNRRGSGESIWDIKERIGIISPELHWYYDLEANVGQTVASGFFDSMSLYQKLSFDQQQKLEQVLYFFDLKEDRNRKLKTLSLGKQRLALLARTVIKNPQLLILDEPCQGMDTAQTEYFNEVVNDLCKSGQTLVYVGHFESQLPSCISNRLVLEKGKVKHLIHEEQKQ